MEYGINLINDQKSDVILFTGDIVNNKSEELLPWVKSFSSLKAPSGIFSVLGNHDYGDYYDWKNKEAKKANMDLLLSTKKKMGWTLLNNDSVYIDKNGEKIAIVGVENWGKGRFKKAGDLNKSVEKISKNDFKVLLRVATNIKPPFLSNFEHDFKKKLISSKPQYTRSGFLHNQKFYTYFSVHLKLYLNAKSAKKPKVRPNLTN